MLRNILNYLEARGKAPLSDIALHLDVDPSAARGMLEQLIRKDRVRCSGQTCETQCSKGCGTCGDAVQAEFYELNT